MPELPEVETIVRDLNKKILGSTICDVWTDFARMVKEPKNFENFKREIKNKKIRKIWRRGKNIIFELSGNKILLIHQKLTGHLLLGQWVLDDGYWKPKVRGPLEDPKNKFLHLMFFLDNGKMLGLSDLRKFAKVLLIDKKEFENLKDIKNLGPEPLDKDFTFKRFEETLRQAQGKIKQVLMDQEVIAGIGNIYSDEILWEARIHPFKETQRLSDGEIKKIYLAMRRILPLAVKLGGESISDFRRISGKKGYFDKERKVYRREGEKCSRCNTIIKKAKIGGRSAHFCPTCQPPTNFALKRQRC